MLFVYTGGMAGGARDVFRYDAFVSYNHASDERLALELRRNMQKIAKPWYRRRALDVFLDQSSLTASPGLWPAIEQSLQRSRYYVLLASPRSAQSKWVVKELGHWLKHRSADSVLLVLTEGSIEWDDEAGDFDWERTDALPRRLEGVFSGEPLYTDMREFRGRERVSGDAAFRGRAAEVAAAVRGVSKDQIVGDDLSQHRRVIRVVWAVAAILLILGVTAAVMATIARKQERRAVAAAEQERVARLAETEARRAEQEERRRAEVSLAGNYASNAGSTGSAVRQLLYSAASVDLADDPVARGEMLKAIAKTPPLLWTIPPGAGGVAAIGFHPDGKRLLTASVDGWLRIWDRASGVELHALSEELKASSISMGGLRLRSRKPYRSHRWLGELYGRAGRLAFHDRAAPLFAMALSPDGRLVAVAGGKGFVHVWDVDRGRLATRIAAHGDSVLALAFHPDGTRLVTGSADDAIGLWKMPNGRPLNSIKDGADKDADAGFWGLAYSPDGRRIYSLRGDGAVQVRDADTLQATIEATTGIEGPGTVALRADGKQLATSRADGVILLWDPEKLTRAGKLEGHRGFVRALLYATGAAAAGTLYSGGADGVRVWDTAALAERGRLDGHRRPVLGLAFDERSGTVASGTLASLRLWDADGEERGRIEGLGLAHDVRITRDGATVVACGRGGIVRVVDAATGAETRRWTTPGGLCVALSPDGKRIAVGGREAVEIRNTSSGARERVLEFKGRSFAVAFSHDGRLVASGGDHNLITAWDSSSGRFIAQLKGHKDGIQDVAFRPRDATTLVSGSEDKTVRVWNVTTGREIRRLPDHAGQVRQVGFLPDGHVVVSAGDDAVLRLTEFGTWKSNGTIKGHKAPGTLVKAGIFGFAFSRSPMRLVTAGADKYVSYWHLGQQRRLASLSGHGDWVTGVDIDAHGARVVSASRDRTVSAWDTSRLMRSAVVRGRTRVTGVGYSRDGSRFITAYENGTVALFYTDTIDDRWTHRPFERRDSIDAIAITATGDVIAVGFGGLAVFPLAGKKPSARERGVSCCVAAAPDGTWLVQGVHTAIVRRDMNGKELGRFTGHEDEVRALAVSPDGTRIISGGKDRTVRLWDVKTGEMIAVKDLHTGTIHAIAYQPGGKIVASASADSTIRLWDASLAEQAVLTAHKNSVNAVAFSPDGLLLVSGSTDLTVRIWDVETRAELARLTGHRGDVSSVAVHPDGGQILSGGEGRFTHLWSLEGLDWPQGECLKRAQDRCDHALSGMDVRRRAVNRITARK